MDTVVLTPPGRFPTVVYDTGQWWSRLSAHPAVDARRVSANAAWWRAICSPDVIRASPSLTRGPLRAWRQRQLAASGGRALAALDLLQRGESYRSAERYLATVRHLIEHLERLNRAQEELWFGVDHGAAIRGLSYTDTRELVDAARGESLLTHLIREAVRDALGADVVLVPITCPADLLTSLTAVRVLRESKPSLYACLVDHGIENFSLAPYMPALRRAGTLDEIFDSVVEAKDERDEVVAVVIDELAAGRRPRGYLRLDDLCASPAAPVDAYRAPPPVETFASESVFWTRISARRCYWSRCTFCVQNLKYDRRGVPSVSEIPAAVGRLRALQDAGYRTFIFSDEALSPALLHALSAGILEEGLDIRWACRSKPERTFSRRLFEELRASGCYEVLFGLESTSPRVLRLMDKEVPGLDEEGMARLIDDAGYAGIGVHLTLIAGFPGEEFSELLSSIAFLSEVIAGRPEHTYSLNRFVLFPETPVFKQPDLFGIRILPSEGDIPGSYDYAALPAWVPEAELIEQTLPALREELATSLGWTRFGTDAGARAAVQLYFQSGIGAVMRSGSENPFATATGVAV